MNKLIPNDQIFKLIQNILLNQWDPIGIKDIGEAIDEYNQYVPKIFNMIIQDKNHNDIADYLYWLETEYMGLKGDIERVKKVSDILINIMTKF